LHSLPLVTLHLTERCNSRCVSCDYWRHGRDDMTLASVTRLLPELLALQTHTVLISGGEPLLHPEWPQIAELLRDRGMSLWLVTSGLSLAKHASRAAALFDAITVSLDGTTPAMYAAIRGLNAFDKVCEGIRRVVLEGARVSIRVTVQRMNYRALPGFVDLAKTLGVAEISFLAADVANTVAFGRDSNFRDSPANLSLQPADLPEFAAIVGAMERTHAEDFRSGLIAESPRKLRRLHEYFAAVCGLGAFPPTHCNAPEFSAVIGATGRVSPCFFINGPAPTAAVHGLRDNLNAAAMIDLRRDIRAGRRPECSTCVCSLWRNPQELSAFRLERASHAAV
jgi:MoaA/NifB/PqqE/SkfB family radical SAM enzyme